MKNLLKLINILFIFIANVANANDIIEKDGLYYYVRTNIWSDNTGYIEVAPHPENSYNGNLKIPKNIKYGVWTYTVTGLREGAFKNCKNLNSVDLSNIESLRVLPYEAFMGCTNLTEIKFPDSELSIQLGSYVFKGCKSLTNIYLPSSLELIGAEAFAGCENLRNIFIPEKTKYIALNSFEGCVNLKNVFFANDLLPEYQVGDLKTAFETLSDDLKIWVPNKEIYGFGQEYITIEENEFEYSASTPQIICRNNVLNYELNYTPFNLVAEVGNYDTEIDLHFTGEINFSIKYPFSYKISPALLNVKVEDLERIYGVINPTFSATYQGFKLNDNENNSLVNILFSTEANIDSNVGEYDINLTAESKNYKLNIKKGKLIITKAFQNIVWNQDLSSINVGDELNLEAKSSSGLPISYTVLPNDLVSLNNTKEGWKLIANKRGNLEIIAKQDGNNNYEEASPVRKNILIKQDLSGTIFSSSELTYYIISDEEVKVINANIKNNVNLKIPSYVNYEELNFKVIEIDDNSFKNAINLETIRIPASIDKIGNDVFVGCDNLKKIEFEYSVNPIQIGYNTSLVQGSNIVSYPNASTVDERRTGFRNCYYDGLFYGLPIEELVINRNIKLPIYYERKLGNKSGNYNTVYNDIVFYPPFYGLKKLKQVEIGENVTSICQNTIDAVMNARPTVMAYTNFGECDKIQTVISKNPLAPVGGGFSQTTYEKTTLYLPNGGKTSYQSDEYWKNFVNIIEGNYIPVESISFESEEISIFTGESKELTLLITPENASNSNVIWKSSNEKVVKVSETGLVTGISEGEAIITAMCGDVSATCQITVVADELLEDSENAGIVSLLENPDKKIAVYSIDGRLIKKDCKVEDLKTLNKGIYIIVSGKDHYKISI